MFIKIFQYTDYDHYSEVYCGEVDFTSIDDVKSFLERQDLPSSDYRKLYNGDLIQVLVGSDRIRSGTYRYEEDYFKPLGDCDMPYTLKPDWKRMLWIEPGKKPLTVYIADELYTLQKAVGGFIEFTYPFNDNVFVIGDDEAKLKGAKGNRRINGEIYAGTILIAGDGNNGKIIDLTEEQVDRYKTLFREPEIITRKEVNDSMRMIFVPY